MTSNNNKSVQDARFHELRLINWMRDDLRAGFDAVDETYHSQLRRAADGVLGDTPRLAHLAEDVVQDGLFKAFLVLRYKPEMISPNLKLRAWLYKIVINQALACLKTGKSHLVITSGLWGEELDEEVLEGYMQHYNDPVLIFERFESIREAKQLVQRAKQVLSPDERTAVDLLYSEPTQPGAKKITSKQVGEAMGKPENTVKSLVNRARKRMHDYLTTTDEEQQDTKKLS